MAKKRFYNDKFEIYEAEIKGNRELSGIRSKGDNNTYQIDFEVNNEEYPITIIANRKKNIIEIRLIFLNNKVKLDLFKNMKSSEQKIKKRFEVLNNIEKIKFVSHSNTEAFVSLVKTDIDFYDVARWESEYVKWWKVNVLNFTKIFKDEISKF